METRPRMFELKCLRDDICRTEGCANRIAHMRGDFNGSAGFLFAYGFVVTRIAGCDGERCQLLGILERVGPVDVFGAKLQQPCDVVGGVGSLIRAERRVSG